MTDLVKLVAPNGVEVQVSAEKAARLVDYQPAKAEPKKQPTK